MVLSAATASAQVNTEGMRRALDGDALTASLDASAAFATGNAEYVLLGLGGRLDARRGPHRGFVVGRFDLSRAAGATFVDRSFAHVRYNRTLAPRVVAEAFGQLERNRQQRLDARALVGAGARVELVDRDSAGLAVGLTPMLEVETVDAEAAQPDAVVRLSSYVAGRLALTPTTALTAVVYAQPRADAPGDARVLAQLALDVGITAAVRLRLRADLRHDSRPPPGVEATDVRVENGLVFVLR